MSTTIGKITNIDGGKFYVKQEDGSLREVSEGYEIQEGELIVGADTNSAIDSVIVSLADGSDIIMLGEQEQLFDAMISEAGFAEPEVVTKNDSVQELIEKYGDEIDVDEIETAAGEEAAAESSAGGEAEFAVFNEASTDIQADTRRAAFNNNADEEVVREEEDDDEEELLVEATLNADNEPSDTQTAEDTQDDVTPIPEDTSVEDTSPEDTITDAEDTSAETTVPEVDEPEVDTIPDAEDTPVVAPEETPIEINADITDATNSGSTEDNVTNDNTPDITGNTEPGSTVTITDSEGNVVGTGTADENGDYTITVDELPDGENTLTVTAEDAAGNTTSTDTTVVVDTGVNSGNGTEGGITADITDATNSGSTEDNVTNDNTPDITGNTEPGSTVTITDSEGNVVGTGTADENGDYTITVDELPDGENTLTVTAEDAAGNTTSTDTTVVVDTGVNSSDDSDTGITADITDATNSGSTEDNVTNDNTPDITGNTEPGSTVTITDENGTVVGTGTADENGDYTITVDELPDGENTLTVTAEDAAGNTTSTDTTVVVDTGVNSGNGTEGGITADITDATNSGSTEDNVTNDNTPDITGNTEPGSTVTITDSEGNVVGTGTADENGDYTITVDELPDGENTLTVTAEDAAGNTTSTDTTVVVDTGVNSSDDSDTGITADITDATNSGSTEDNVTNDNTPDITGNTEPGSTVTITDENGNVVGTGTADENGDYTITVDELPDGENTLTVTAEDAAGNTTSTDTTVVVDTGVNSGDDSDTGITADITDATNSGSTEDNVTNDNTPDITGNTEPGSTVTITDSEGNVVGTGTADENGDYTITVDELPDGENTLTVTAEDAAGNTTSTDTTVVVDTGVNSGDDSDTGITADITDATNSGSTEDNVTNDNTPDITGNTEPGSTVTITDSEGNVVGTGTADENGDYTITVDELPDGENTLTVTAEDAAGNTTSTDTTVVVDTGVNSGNGTEGGITADITDATNSGSTEDNVTNDNTPDITGNTEPGSTVTITDSEGNVVGTGTADENGDYTITVDELPDGENTLTVTAEDAAGNATSTDTTVVVDTTTSESETGTVTVGDITADDVINSTEAGQTIAVTGTATGGVIAEGDAVTTEINGTTYTSTVDADGNYSLDVAGSDLAADTEFTVDVTSTDVAGNTVTSSADSTHTVDITTSDAPVITNIIDANGDYENVTLYGTGEPGETITLYVRDNSTTNGNDTQTGDYVTVENTNIVVDANGNWSLDISNLEDVPVNDNEFFKATQTDSAGNVSEFSNTAHYYHGTFKNAATEIGDDFVMMGTGNDTVQIKVDDSNDSLVVDGGNGTDTVKMDMLYSDVSITNQSENVYVVTENNGSGDVNELRNIEKIEFSDGVYDLENGVFVPNDDAVVSEDDPNTGITAELSDDTNSGSTEDNITNDNTPDITGNTEAGAEVYITDKNGNTVGEGTADENGNYTINVEYELPEGENTLTVTAEDEAGNITSTTVTVDIDTQASDIGKLAITNITDDNGDHSSITMYGTGAEAGNTVTLYNEDKEAVATAIIDENGEWTADITNLDGTPINDNEFFSVIETDAAGNETAKTDTTHFNAFNWDNTNTESSDDYAMAGSDDDTINTDDTLTGTNENGTVTSDNDDTNDFVVIDGGNGDDTVVFGGNYADYTITTNELGYTIVTEGSSSDSDDDGKGDVSELRNVETIEFADGIYSSEAGIFTPNNEAEMPSVSMSLSDGIASEFTTTTTYDLDGNGSVTTNVVITLDLSGSIDRTELALAKEALDNMIDKYGAEGGVNVYLTTFSGSATNYGWMNAADAKAEIDSLTSGGSTNYEAAIQETVSNYGEAPTADTTVAYFISDGSPTTEINDGRSTNFLGFKVDGERGYLDTDYVNTWNTFVSDNVDTLNIIGIGVGDNTSYLETLAAAQVGTDVTEIESVNDLDATLASTSVTTVDGYEYEISINASLGLNIDDNDALTVTINGVPDGSVLSEGVDNGDGTWTITVDGNTYESTVTMDVPAKNDGSEQDFSISTTATATAANGDATSATVDEDGMYTFDVTNSLNGEIEGGDSYDIINIDATSESISFDLNALSGKISNIEEIDLSGSNGDVKVNLNLEDVLEITDKDNTLRIEGDNGDIIDLNDSDWTIGDHLVDSQTGAEYDVYSNNDYDVTLEINTNIHVDES